MRIVWRAAKLQDENDDLRDENYQLRRRLSNYEDFQNPLRPKVNSLTHFDLGLDSSDDEVEIYEESYFPSQMCGVSCSWEDDSTTPGSTPPGSTPTRLDLSVDV